MAQLSKGCRMCGKNVIHLDGKCDVYMHAGVCNSDYGGEANTAQDSKRNSNLKIKIGVDRINSICHSRYRAMCLMT